ncbi:MAG: efflux RND transporter periplasmic adaptor subunit [Hyphomicrobiaceae bacterium]|nr:efflux RND transporter periplasmic adaptor subunit [Hyphomicrobiaceae bacterium]
MTRPVLMLLAIGFLLWLPIAELRAQSAPPAIPVTVASPLSKKISTWDEFWGRLEPVQRVEVRPRISGFIEQVHFTDGAMVKAGDLLFTIDKRPFEIAVDAAKAEVSRQEAQLELARSDVERAEPLAKTKVLSEQVYEQRKSSLSVAQAQIEAARANLKSAQLNLEWAEVRAPLSGRISDRKVDAGNLVNGGVNSATLLATIVSLDPIHFVFDVSEADYLRYSRLYQSGERSSRENGIKVRLKLSDEDDYSREGRMDFVDNTLNERSATVRARAVFDNKDGFLTPGVFGRLALFGGESQALLIPDAAILSDQANKIVLTVNAENTVVAMPVVLGQIVDGLRVVSSGLKGDEHIIIQGVANPMVRPGAKVAPEDGTITASVTPR